jgi:large repetitive protein
VSVRRVLALLLAAASALLFSVAPAQAAPGRVSTVPPDTVPVDTVPPDTVPLDTAPVDSGPPGSSPYPPGCASVGTDQAQYAPGTTVTITARGVGADAGTTITFTITLVNTGSGDPTVITLTAVADDAGVAVVTLTAPQVVGSYTVSVSTITCGEVSSGFGVQKKPVIPKAGSDVLQGVVTATVVVTTGLVLWLVARRRRTRSVA